ncbi:MAG: efflux RND transporter periplasmic adaptor subunit [Phycisphaerae bacterium]
MKGIAMVGDASRVRRGAALRRGVARGVVVFAVAAAALTAYLFWATNRKTALVVSGYVEADQVRVGSRVGGRVAEVRAVEGAEVRPGVLLLRIEAFDLNERLAEAEAQLAEATAEAGRLRSGFRAEEVEQAKARRSRAESVLAKLESGPRKREVQIARERLSAAQSRLELAKAEHERVLRLSKESQAAQIEMERVTAALRAATAESAMAEQEVGLLEEGTRAEEVAEARAARAEADAAARMVEAGYRKEEVARAESAAAAAQARVAAMRQAVAELTVASPCACVVEAVELRPGDLTAANAPALTLLDLSRKWVRAYVPEAAIARFGVGQRVPVGADGFGDRRFWGRISFIATEAEFVPRNVQTPEERSKQVFRIKVTLEEGGESLRVGMPVDVYLDEAEARAATRKGGGDR